MELVWESGKVNSVSRTSKTSDNKRKMDQIKLYTTIKKSKVIEPKLFVKGIKYDQELESIINVEIIQKEINPTGSYRKCFDLTIESNKIY